MGTGDDVDYAMARETENAMKIPVIRHEHKKPACMDEVRTQCYAKLYMNYLTILCAPTLLSGVCQVLGHFASSTGQAVAPSQICMIGK